MDPVDHAAAEPGRALESALLEEDKSSWWRTTTSTDSSSGPCLGNGRRTSPVWRTAWKHWRRSPESVRLGLHGHSNAGDGWTGSHPPVWKVEQEEEEPTPIVALSAFAFDHDKEAAKEAGVDMHMSKPFSREELQAMCLRFISLHRFVIVPTVGLGRLNQSNHRLKYVINRRNRIKSWFVWMPMCNCNCG